MVVSRRTHDYCQAAVVDTHFKWLFNSQSLLALLLRLFLPMGHPGIHHTLWIKWRTPVA
jgi:hypothetical protein